MRIVTGSALFKLPFLRSFGGIVLGRCAFFAANTPSARLVAHELVHQEQMDRHGVVGFYLRYLGQYLRLRLNGKSHSGAYDAMPLEREAYARQNEPELIERARTLLEGHKEGGVS